MTFTYNSASITTDLAKIRFELQDTDSTQPLLTDEEIAYALTQESGVLAAAAHCAETIARKYARDFNWGADGDSVDRVARARQWQMVAADLRKRASSGISVRSTVNRDGSQPVGQERSHADREFGGLGVDLE